MAGDMPRAFEPNEAQEIRQAIEKASNLVYLADAAKTLDEADDILTKRKNIFRRLPNSYAGLLAWSGWRRSDMFWQALHPNALMTALMTGSF
jgi:hypothetical protein